MSGELPTALVLEQRRKTDVERRLDNQARLPQMFVLCPACAELEHAHWCRYCLGTRKTSRAFAREWFAQVGLLRESA